MRRRSVVFVALTLTILGAARSLAQQARDTAAEHIHRLVLAEDFEAAMNAGKALARRGAASPEAQAWTIEATARYGMVGTARQAARAMQRSYPGRRWSAYALLAASDSQAPREIRRARAVAPWDPFWVAAYATTLPRTRPGRPDPLPALALLDSALSRSPTAADLWQARAATERLAMFAGMRPDTAAGRRALAACDQALRLDSARAGVWSTRARTLLDLGSPGAALAAAQRAVAVLPTSLGAHRLLWDMTARRPDLDAGQKGESIATDVEALAKVRGRTAGLLLAAARTYGELELAAPRDALVAELRRDHPGSWELEQLELDDIERLDDQAGARNPDSLAARTELLRRISTFTAQPGRSPRSLGRAYDIQLWRLERDTAAPLADLARATEGAMRYGDGSGAQTTLLRLAEHAETRALAKRLAPRLPAVLTAGSSRLSFAGDSTEALRRNRQLELRRRHQAMGHDLLGWIAFNEGRYRVAAQELARAAQLDSSVGTTQYHLGRLAERRGRLHEAAVRYIAAYPDDRFAAGRPAETALRRVFTLQDSTPGAFDRFLARRRDAARAREEARKEQVRQSTLAERLAHPRPLPALKLTRLDGGSFSVDELAGKIGVVNFWGTWCGPCVQELPTIQKLYERYRNDPDVLVVTIDDERGAADPRRLVTDFMTARQLTFPVLLADSSTAALVLAWPTTWYVDRQGRIAYEQRGAVYSTADPVEPFIWRVESLRDTTATPLEAAPAPGSAKAPHSQPAAPAPGPAGAPEAALAPTSPPRDSAAARIRRLYHASLYEQAMAAEKGLERNGRATAQSRAWAIAAMAAYGMADEALAAANALRRQSPAGPWSTFARAMAATAPDSAATAAAMRARSAEPWNPDFVWLQATVLSRVNARARIAALLDSAWTRLTPDAPLYEMRAAGVRIVLTDAARAGDSTGLPRRMALLDSALVLDSTLLDAWSSKADLYSMQGMRSAAAEMGRRAARAIPASPRAHELYWGELRQVTGTLPADTLTADVERLFAAAGRTAGALLAASEVCQRAGLGERSEALQAELLRRFPGSFEAERVQLNQLATLRDDIAAGRESAPGTSARFRRLARTFTATPGRRPRALGTVFDQWLDVVATDSAAPAAELQQVLEGALRYGRPEAVSARSALLRLAGAGRGAAAERLGRGYPAMHAAFRHFNLPPGTRDTAAFLRALVRADTGVVHDLIAWRAFHEGRLDAASAELKIALELAPDDPLIHYHLGRLAQRRGDHAAAAAAYATGLKHGHRDEDQPNLPALRALLALRASLPVRQGIESALRDYREGRRAAVLATRLSGPRPLPPVKLAGLNGGGFAPDSLRGRIAVIDFWATWCGPCVRALPQIQRLYDAYRGDPHVAVVSVNADLDQDHARAFLEARGFTFPVFVADSLLQASIRGYPTTWFVDRQGRIAYEQFGGEADLQSFYDAMVWRIDSLREAAEGPPAAPGTSGNGTAPAPVPTRAGRSRRSAGGVSRR